MSVRLSNLYILTNLILRVHLGGKLRLREAELLAYVHRAKKWKSQDREPGGGLRHTGPLLNGHLRKTASKMLNGHLKKTASSPTIQAQDHLADRTRQASELGRGAVSRAGKASMQMRSDCRDGRLVTARETDQMSKCFRDNLEPDF